MKKADSLDSIESLLPGLFDVNEIRTGVPVNQEYAFAARKVAFDLVSDNQVNWQHYWFNCCISDKCDYIFSILKSKDIDREEDLKKICSHKSELWSVRGDDEMQYYINLCIVFFLKRYNLFGAALLCFNNFSVINFVNIFLPRLAGAILIGFIPIATSEDIRNFANDIQLNILLYAVVVAVMLLISYIYLLFECHKTIREPKVSIMCTKRSLLVLGVGFIESMVFSSALIIINFLRNEWWCWKTVLFFATFAFLIGILIQLLWEEKTVTEPL